MLNFGQGLLALVPYASYESRSRQKLQPTGKRRRIDGVGSRAGNFSTNGLFLPPPSLFGTVMMYLCGV